MKIFHQIHIYEEDLKAFKAFKFEFGYKYGIPLYIWTLFLLKKSCELLRLSLSREKCCMSGEDWQDIYWEFLEQGLTNIMTATPPTHTTTPRSPRLKPTATGAATTMVEPTEATTVKKQKKPQKPP
jgi:hypothetical protein